ncbi:MAG: ABC transporter substrate-binding protein, partial [Betaproteobacteria bacterium]|nr:ABC transporter substrate-binding protein [Betaproteobacteria bacterium]
WKFPHDAGQMYEQLFAADLDKSKHKGGRYPFIADGWIPADAVRGELAESWKLKDNPLRVEITLRKGVMFPEKPGVMATRELTAADVVYAYERYDRSPKKLPGFYEHIEKVEAADRYRVIFHFKHYQADWDYKLGWGVQSAIVPKEVFEAGAANWKNANGTGPFALADVVPGTSNTYARNPAYWDKERLGGQLYRIPFVDKVVTRTIKDEATQHAMLRAGKLDLLQVIRWNAADELKKTVPALKWSRYLATNGTFLAMRVDRKPFDDIRVRRALNFAVNKQEIISAYYGGNAELFAYPMSSDYLGYYEPLSAMPDPVKELFGYNPQKAKKLLSEAGYPNGFAFKVQVCSCSPDHLDLLPLVAAYLEQVGVKVEIQPMEYGAFLSAMTTKTHASGYFMVSGRVNPISTLRKSFVSGQTWNPSMWSDPAFDRGIDAVHRERDEEKRQEMLKALNRDILAKAPYLWLPTPYLYSAWWPWVKNYGGELRAAAYRPAPIYARIWIDQDLKKKMGF